MSSRVRHGRHDDYHWCWSRDHDLWRLVHAVPELVVGRVVAVTAFDGGPLRPSPDEQAAGWEVHGGVAWSPRIENPDELPLDGWDEWYVYRARVELADPEVFVNQGRFCPDPRARVAEPTWCRSAFAEDLDLERQMAARFWSQMERLRPIVYLAEGDWLTCATLDRALAVRVRDALSRSVY